MTTNLSHLKGPTDLLLLNSTIGDLFEQSVEKYSDREAAIFIEQDKRYTYAQLNVEINKLAAGLLKIGLIKGDRLGIWSPNRSEWLITQFATAKTGIILVNINPAFRQNELEYALNKVEAKAIIIAAKFKSSNYIEMMQKLVPETLDAKDRVFVSSKIPSLKYIIRLGDEKTSGMFNFDEVTGFHNANLQDKIDKISQSLSPNDAINVQFTSGTTGTPKGATLSHYNIVNNANFVTQTLKLDEHDILCLPVPLYHCFGMVMGSLGCLIRGAKLVFPSEAFEPFSALEAIEKEKCTALYAVPTMFVTMFSDPSFKHRDFSNLRTGIMAGALCPIEIMNKAVSDMNLAQLTICYGMTETSPVSFQTHVDTPIDKRVTTVGKIHPHLEVKLVDENGTTTHMGTKGELCTRGYSVMIGYWADETATNNTIDEDGWLHTGDIATFDEQGYCIIVGRIKDMIIRGGENISPREIEDFLFEHDDIINVQIFGIDSTQYGEEVCAFITLADGRKLSTEEVKKHCKDKIAHYKIPRHIRFVDEMPMTVTGKPQKFKMKEMMESELR